MSLVNLAHVCSHLQNASTARLALTSIPYTKLHLSITTLLHKQGFLSTVKLGGPLPPVSTFGPGQIQSHNTHHSRSPEAALSTLITQRLDRSALRERKFDQEAIDFAEEHGIKTFEELRVQGYDQHVVAFILDTRQQIETAAAELEREDLKRSYLEDRELELDSEAETAKRLAQAAERVVAELSPVRKAVFQRHGQTPVEELQATEFDHDVLVDIAGLGIYKTPWEIQRDGITIQAMGLSIPNQLVELPLEESMDDGLADEEGIITQANRASRRLWLGMKYYNSNPVLSKARLVSKPAKRIWLSSRELVQIVRGHRAGEVRPLTQIGEIMIVSTDKGIMEARECVERRIGGQPLARFW